MGRMRQAFTEARQEMRQNEAQQALDAGRNTFVVQLRAPLAHTAALSRPVPQVAEQIDAIEAVGWRLADTTSFVSGGNIELVCVFRRAAPRPMPQQPMQPGYPNGQQMPAGRR